MSRFRFIIAAWIAIMAARLIGKERHPRAVAAITLGALLLIDAAAPKQVAERRADIDQLMAKLKAMSV